MKKLLLSALILLCCISQSQAWMNVTTVGGGVPAAGDTYSDIVFFWRCEGTTLAADDCYGTDNVATTNSSAAINADAANIGTNGFDSPSAMDWMGFDNNAEYAVAEGRFGAWIRVTAFVSGFGILSVDTDGTDNVRVYFSGTDDATGREVLVRWRGQNTNATDLVTTTMDLAEGTWFFLEVAWKQATNYREVFLNGASVASSSAAMTAWGSTPTTVYYGDGNAASGGDVHFDNIMLSSDSTRNLYALRNLTACPR